MALLKESDKWDKEFEKRAPVRLLHDCGVEIPIDYVGAVYVIDGGVTRPRVRYVLSLNIENIVKSLPTGEGHTLVRSSS